MDQIFMGIGAMTVILVGVAVVFGLVQTVRQVFVNADQIARLERLLSERAFKSDFEHTREDVHALYLAAKKAGWLLP